MGSSEPPPKPPIGFPSTGLAPDVTSAVVIRPVELADYPAATALWNRTSGLSEIEPPDVWARIVTRNPGLSQAAWAGDDLVGIVMVGHDGRRATLFHLAVEAAYRRRHIAQSLLDAARIALAQEGITRMMAFVFTQNPSGMAFWDQQGWSRRDELSVYDSRDKFA